MSANLIRAEDDRYYDVAGRPASPYSTVTSFLASPLFVENTKLYAGRHYFYVDSRFILSNTGLSINSIQSVSINYNGTVTTQPPGTPLQVDFQTSTQEQTITLTVTLTNGVSYEQPVTIPELPYSTTQTWSCDGGTQITVRGAWFDGGYGTGGYEAEGTAYIYFADQNCQTRTLRKPIVFLDGFDPDNSRDHNEIYQKNINRVFVEGNQLTELGNELRSRGYDIVIFDYNKQGKKYDRGGAGLVENNGLAVAKLLTTLHDTYSSSIEQDFVVIGPSMGALVGQYALAFMEKNNIPHHTRLFVSFDGPHQGANLSIGLQSFIDIFLRYGNLSVFKSLSHGLHQSASAKQMLVDHSSVLSEAPEPHPYRSIFLRNLAAAGNYPTQCRTIAITSGSGNGTLNQNFNPCDKLVQMAVKKRLLPNCTNNYCYKMKADIFASAESNSCLAVNFFANGALYDYRGLGAPPLFLRATQPNAFNTSYDKAPGSRFQENPIGSGVFSEYKWIKRLAYIFSGKLQINDDRLHTDTFVPSVSAVDFRPPSGGVNLYTNLSQYDLTKCSGRTPFDKAYIGNDNLYHVEINAQIASWFREEVYQQKAPSQCTTNNPNCGNGSGLTTTYYNNQDLQGSPVATFNGNIDIIGDQSGTLPNSGQLAQNVSARWEGQVEAPVSGSYTFNVRTDDGVRVWFDNQQRVDDFGYYPPRDHNFSVNLTAGQKYNVKVEWKQGSGGFEAKMFWNYPGQSNQIVPSCWLFPTSGGGGGCTAPNPPTVSASPTSISSGGYSDLSASGCSGTVKWSHDASAPSNVRVYPGGTTTYTATCEANGCTSSGASVTVTVNGGGSGGSFSQCIEAENSSGNGPVTGDPNASSGQTRGAENNYNHYVEYTVTGVPTPGNYTLTLQYYSAPSGPTVEVSVTQGGSGSQTKTMPNSGSWNIVHTTYDFTVNLGAGTNKIKIQGTGGGSCRQDKICVTGGGGGGCTPPGAPSLSATANPINAGQSTTLTASGCGGTVNWNTPGGNPTVSPASTTTYTATCTVNGCTSGNGSVTITVNGTPPSGSCSASNDQCSGNQYEVRNYTVSVPSSGSYTLRVTYRSHEGNGAIRWSVNGGGAQTKPVSQTALDPYQEVDLGSASLSAGNNTVSLSSGALYVCFRKVCANSGSARLGVAEEPATDSPELTVSPNPNDGEFVARFYVEPGRKATLRVSDIQGREVWKKNLTGQGAHSEPVRLPAQSIGSYILLLDKEATDSKGKADRRPAQFKRVIVVK